MDNLHTNISPNFKMMTYKQVETFQKFVKSTPSFTNISSNIVTLKNPKDFLLRMNLFRNCLHFTALKYLTWFNTVPWAP